ncbi:Dystrophin [Gallus gallus] [Rhizoctonia solani]|uniref:Dystrophin [Gallus gallus] n=1 Tax=Rhizoctonia solani TaxID=456999 RepID=A0A0K6G6I3_9AGAM|nr:Dystrophin [Gallus gallus] [Rhizoctonia solani]
MKRKIDFDSTLDTFQGPIVDWCNSLRNSTICEIKLVSSPELFGLARLSVVVLLQDGSVYRLSRALKWGEKSTSKTNRNDTTTPTTQDTTEKKPEQEGTATPTNQDATKKKSDGEGTIMPDIQDTIEKVSVVDMGPSSHPFVTITFKQGYYPELLHLLRVCHGIQKHGLMFKAPHVVMDFSNNFFALALFLNVARSCLPHKAQVNTAGEDCALLEGLWQEVYQSLQKQGTAFWENTIAEHTTNLTKELIYRLARYKVRLLLGSHWDTEDNSESEESSIVASIVARIQALAENKGLSDTIVWDEAWDRRWSEIWNHYRPVVPLRKSGKLQTITSVARIAAMSRISGISSVARISSLAKGLTTISLTVDGCAAGRICGRTLVELPSTKSRSILLNALWKGHNHRPKTPESQDPATNRSRLSTEVTGLNVLNIPTTERSILPIEWLGNSCFYDSKTYQVWATPRECAIESAWTAAWFMAEPRGKMVAENVTQSEPEADPPNTAAQANIRSRIRTKAHPATEAISDLATWASHRLSKWLNRGRQDQGSSNTVVGNHTRSTERVIGLSGQVPRTGSSRPMASLLGSSVRDSAVTTLAATMTSSPVSTTFSQAGGSIHSPMSPRSRRFSEISQLQRHSGIPEGALPSILESRIDLPAQVQGASSLPTPPAETAPLEPFPTSSPIQTSGQRHPESSGSPSGTDTPRTRIPSATVRLRKRVITRYSDDRRNSDFQAKNAFENKVRERIYGERKTEAREQAAQILKDLTSDSKPQADAQKLAKMAWERAVAYSGRDHFEQSIKSLARQKWDEQADRYEKDTLLVSLGDQPSTWEANFLSTWQYAWEEAWAAAWTAVWDLSYKEAASRGIGFGIEEVLDLDPKLQRSTYKELESSEPFVRLRRSLLDNQSPAKSLEQVHRWMKELGYLSESLQYSVPTLHDECMEITVAKSSEVKAREAAKKTSEPIRMSHYDLQEWLTKSYILDTVHGDQKLHNLFLRGIAEVWESMSAEPGQQS